MNKGGGWENLVQVEKDREGRGERLRTRGMNAQLAGLCSPPMRRLEGTGQLNLTGWWECILGQVLVPLCIFFRLLALLSLLLWTC